MDSSFVVACLTGYKDIISECLPVVLTILGSNIGINIIARAFATGKLDVRGGK